MLASMTISRRRSECTQRLNELQGLEGEAFGAEQRSEMDRLGNELVDLETKFRASVAVEAVERQESGDPETPEQREIGQLMQRASIVDYLEERLEGRGVDGAASELRNAIFGADSFGYVPLAMLAPRQRVDAQTNIGTAIQDNQQSIAPRVFVRSVGEYLGVESPTVPVGTTTYPMLNGGTTADVRSPGVELDGTAATLAMKSFDPVRLTASYRFTRETLAKVRGFEDALLNDMRGVMAEKRDALILNGQAAQSNVRPKIEGILNAVAAATQNTITDWAAVLAAFDDAVDDKNAATAGEVRMLVPLTTWRFARTLQIATSGQLLRDLLGADRFRGSAHMPAESSNVAQVLLHRTGAQGGAISPTWEGAEVTNDPFTGAKAGEVQLTIASIVGFEIVNYDDAFEKIAFKTA